MAYELHITRADDWTDSDRSPIELPEWIACVEADPELRREGYAEVETRRGRIIRYENPGLAVWTGRPRHADSGPRTWFEHTDDHVAVRNPDRATVVKMVAVARCLAARVQGDDGELYGADGRPRPSAADAPTWWRRLLGT